MCMCCLSLSLSWCAHICVRWCACTETWGDLQVSVSLSTLFFFFLRWDLSLNLELGWQSANPSTPPASGPHSAGFTAAMDSHGQLLHRFWAFEFRSSSYKKAFLPSYPQSNFPGTTNWEIIYIQSSWYLILVVLLFVVIIVWLLKKISIFSWCWHHSL